MTVTRDVSMSFPTQHLSNFSNYVVTYPTQRQSRVVTTTRQRTGTRLPNWHKVIEQGGNATTPLSAVFDTSEATKGSASVSCLKPGYGSTNVSNSGDLFLADGSRIRTHKEPTADPTFADNLARAKFYKKLREIQVQFSGPTFLGELREAVHMLRRPGAALYDKAGGYLSSLGKAKRRDPKHWLKTASGLWLEQSFGWQPLINDVYDAATAYRRLTTTRRKKIISAGGEAFYDFSRTLDGTAYGNGTYQIGQGCCFDFDIRLYNEVIVRYKGAITATSEATQWDNWALFGFTPSEFLPTAWELLPWSFLVDYFTNIGDIVTSSVTCYSKVQYANKTVIKKSDYRGMHKVNGPYTASFLGAGNLVSASSSPSDFRLTRKRVERSVGGGVPMPTLQLSFDLSNGKLLNIAALLGQARALHPQTTPTGYRPFRR